MADYVAGKGTTALGIIGTALGGLAATGTNLLGMNGWNNNGYCCDGSMVVNRYELNQEKELANAQAEIVYWRGQDKTNEKISAAYANLEGQIKELAREVRCNKDEQTGINMQQAVYNGVNTATIECIKGQVASLYNLTKLVVPNTSVCPGWGDVTITPATTTTGA